MKQLTNTGKDLMMWLTVAIIFEGLYMVYIIYTEGYINKVFILLGFMIMAKLGQIQTIMTYSED